jgi:hypothetical protein
LPTREHHSVNRAIAEMALWAAKWSKTNKLDGHTEHLIIFDRRTRQPHLLFKSRAECRAWIEKEYGYIREREDLRRESHCWRLPQAVRVDVIEQR